MMAIVSVFFLFSMAVNRLSHLDSFQKKHPHFSPAGVSQVLRPGQIMGAKAPSVTEYVSQSAGMGAHQGDATAVKTDDNNGRDNRGWGFVPNRCRAADYELELPGAFRVSLRPADFASGSDGMDASWGRFGDGASSLRDPGFESSGWHQLYREARC